MGVYTVNQTDGSLQRVAGGTLYADAPIGAIQSYGGVIAPAGWLICDGSAVSRTEYAELFAVIGINFGEGDGETTFGIPDLRECVPVGAGKNITKSIANHDRYDLGQFKDDALGTHNHPLVSVTTATFNTAGVPVGIGNNNTPTSATHGKQLGVNYIIKAKMVGVPADLEAQIDADYQKKDLTSAVEGETTVEDALGALSTNKASKVSNATNGDIASLDANGNLVDSGYSKSLLIDNTNDAVKAISTYASAALLNITDANDIKFADAMIYCGSSVSNLPTADYYNIKVFSINNDSTVYEQIAFRSGTPVEIYTRRHTSSVGWTFWQRLATESDISVKADKATTAHTFSFLITGSMQRTVKIPNGAKQLGIDIKATSQNTRGSEFVGTIVGYGTMQDNRAVCLYKRLESNAILISDISDDGQYTSFIIGNPFATGDQTVIMTLYNIDRSNVTVESPISNTITAMGSRWQEYITSKEVSYSTSETLTGGKWIDGKPIYRKVYDFGSLPNNGTKNVAIGDDTIRFISLQGIAVSGRVAIPIPGDGSTGTNTVFTSTTNVTIKTSTDMSAYTGYVIAEYTKTTD